MQAEKRSETDFSERTDRMAVRLGISIKQLAKRIGVSPGMLSSYRSGSARITDRVWLMLEMAERALEPPAGVEKKPRPNVLEEMVATPDHSRRNPTREECEAQLARAITLAQSVPGGLGIVYSDIALAILELQRRADAVQQIEDST